jgi:DNA-binding NtrC family response regulator
MPHVEGASDRIISRQSRGAFRAETLLGGAMSFKDIDAFLEAEGAPSKGMEVVRPHVLVVDDDPTIRVSLSVVLQRSYQLILCASAREGVAAVNDDVCAAILDVKMAKHDGFWTCKQIRQKYPDLPVIFYSAYQDAKDPYDIINEHRPFGYITKGSDTKRLLEAVDMAVSFYTTFFAGKMLLDRYKQHRRKGS